MSNSPEEMKAQKQNYINVILECLADPNKRTTILKLKLGYFTIPLDKLKQLVLLLESNNFTDTLELPGNKMSDDGAKILGELLEKNNTLTTLDINNNDIASEGIKVLCRGLASNYSIAHIELFSNKIGKEGTRRFADALRINRTLTHLDLGANGIGDDGCKTIANVFLDKSNSTLTSLALSQNDIGNEGAKAIANALKVNKSIVYVTLSLNQIKIEGFRELGAMLQVNNTLSWLNLYFNDAKEEGGIVIHESLEKPSRNVSLISCRLAENEQKIKELTSKNQIIQRRLSHLWSKVCPAIAFYRANYNSVFRDSILSLVPEISKYLGMEMLMWTRY